MTLATRYVAIVSLLAVACTREPAPSPVPERAPAPRAAQAPAATGSAGASAGPTEPPAAPVASAAPTAGPRFVAVPEDLELATFLRTARLRAKGEGRLLVVYVGAAWCPPCRRFHSAVAAGRLDAAAGRTTLVELDADRDAERLSYLGYMFKNIPYFAVVGENGRPRESHAVVDVKPTAEAEIATTLGDWQRAFLVAER